MTKYRGRRSAAAVILAVCAMLAAVLSLPTPAGSQTDDGDPVAADPGPVDATDPVGGPGPVDDGLSADQVADLEADAAAEIGDDVVMDGTPIVPQGTNAALTAGDAGDDDNTAGLTPDPDPGLLAGSAGGAAAGPVVNSPEPGTSSSISFADAAGTASDLDLPPYVQLEIDTAERHRIVTVDGGALAADLDAESVGVALFDDVVADLVTTVAPSAAADGTLVYGADGANETDAATVTIAGDDVVGQWWIDGVQYGMLPIGGGTHVVFEIARQFDCEDSPTCALGGHDHDEEDVWVNPATDLTGNDGADIVGLPVISVLVVVDGDALAFYGGNQDTARQQVSAMVNGTNQAYRNSSSEQHLNLAGISFVGTSSTTNMNTYLDRLTNKTDGFIDAVHTTRDSLGADLIALISGANYPGLCGLAWLPSMTAGLSFNAENRAFSISRADCAVGGLTFSHEIAHNQCAGHDNSTTTCNPPYVDSRGHVSPGDGVRTIMAVNSNPETRLPYYSNPSVNYPGTSTPTGVTGVRDNHRVMELEDLGGGSGGLANYRAGTQSVSIAGNDGASCIFETLEQAVNLSAPGSTIYVAPGTYPAQSSGLNYNISKDLDIVQGTSQCEPTASPVTNGVILQPAAGTTGDAVLEISGAGTLVTLDHITVEGSTATSDGGNVQVFAGSELVLDDSIVRNANVGVDGGGVRVLSGGTLTSVGNSQIENNTTTGNGGGVYVDGGTVNLDGQGDIDLNSAVDGGGIYAVNGAVVNVTSNADILSNSASSDGGGIYADNSTIAITDSGSFVGFTGSGNSAGTGGGGGVFATNSASVTIDNGGEVRNNTANFAGGVRTTGSAIVSVNDGGAVSSNSATGLGGGGFYSSAPSTIDLNPGSTVSANTSTDVGGAGRVFGILDVDGNTTAGPVVVSNNSAALDGGGFWLAGSSSHGIDHASFTGNSAVNGGALFVGSSSTLNVTEDLACQASTLAFEEYCNAFDDNSVTGLGAAIYLDAGATLNAVQAGFQGNDAPGGSVVMITDTASASVRSSMFLTNDTGGGPGGDGVITWNGTPTSIRIIGVTFGGNNPQLAMDSDGTPSALEVSRVLTDNGTLGIGTATGDCNLSAVSTGTSLPNRIIADPRFEPTADTAWSPAPLGPAADRCALLGGHVQDALDRSAVDADGDASATEYDIGGVEALKQPIVTPGGIGGPEGNSGISVFPVPVYLDEPHSAPVTVQWQTFDPGGVGIATANVDYIAASGTVTFDPGETQETVFISVIGDTTPEVNLFLGEWLPIAFSNVSQNAELDLQTFFGLGLVIIGNDDGPPPP